MAEESNNLDFNLGLKSATAAQDMRTFVAGVEQAAKQAKVKLPVEYVAATGSAKKAVAVANREFSTGGGFDGIKKQVREVEALTTASRKAKTEISGLRMVLNKFGTSSGTDPIFERLVRVAPQAGIALAAFKAATLGLEVSNLSADASHFAATGNMEGQVKAEAEMNAMKKSVPFLGDAAEGLANKYNLGNYRSDRLAVADSEMETKRIDARTARMKAVGDIRANLAEEGLGIINASSDTMRKRAMTPEAGMVVDIDRHLKTLNKKIEDLPQSRSGVPADVLEARRSLEDIRQNARNDAVTATQSRQALMRSSVNVANLDAGGMSYQAGRAAFFASRREGRLAFKDPTEQHAYDIETRGLGDAMEVGRSRQGREAAYGIDTGIRQDRTRLGVETLRANRMVYQADVKEFQAAQDEKVKAAFKAMQKAGEEGAPQVEQAALQRQYEAAREGRTGAMGNFQTSVKYAASEMMADAAQLNLRSAHKPLEADLAGIERQIEREAKATKDSTPEMAAAAKAMGRARIGAFMANIDGATPTRFEAVAGSTTDLQSRLGGRQIEDVASIRKTAAEMLKKLTTIADKAPVKVAL